MKRHGPRHPARLRPLLAGALGAALLAGCAAPPARPPASVPAHGSAAPRASVTDVAVYPARGQDSRALRRDRYECNAWAVRQSGHDPATMQRAATPVPRVEPDPPTGLGAATGAVSGAVLGAIVANPHHSGQGAAVGAVIGAAAGAASDAARDAQAERIEDAYARRAAERDDRATAEETRYRRALGACLEGRGYTVR
ncbi:MAG: glycine zipper 2TM domain-containing protein [Gammaproteobacteria bacterium]|jgi:hypothetical protein|nr:glycine zipper 2TM domain-containing protein [Gammaproteobacteria bacterium]MBU0773005.1 glycine zipper 2TM domain-containing protein [Gammaproteobacteria bacterium]MBU0856503.1 glycine zipper 2TM domain-containing protein [Gammaproteobacteria bacterium]MBU1847717.1 glycine zipper 2TM domain-containing protein [Gammaproteobacteria bacterium]